MKQVEAQISSKVVINRLLLFLCCLFLVQLFHLSFMVEFNGMNFVVLFLLYSLLFSIFSIHRLAVVEVPRLFRANYRIVLLFLIVGFIGKSISRYDYISSWLSDGLRFARSGENSGSGGWYSYLSIFFYPAAILWATVPRDSKLFRYGLALVVIVILVDFVFVGTRNSPVFVMFFYAIFYRGRYTLNMKKLLMFLTAIFLFLMMFSYTTEYRLIGTDFSWKEHLEHTISTQVVHISPGVILFFEDYLSALFPLLFLMHYISHSIGEINYLIMTLTEFKLDIPIYLMSELCVTGFCDKAYYESLILITNPRAGVYQTILSSLAFDLGLLWSIVLLLTLGLFSFLVTVLLKRLSLFSVMLLVILALSPIENYLYGGLGLVQISMIFVIYYVGCLFGNKEIVYIEYKYV